jgi:hypothetical protein
MMKEGECRGAKPIYREAEGVPQIYFLPPSWPGPLLGLTASPRLDEGKWDMGMVGKGMVEKVFQRRARSSNDIRHFQ